MRGGTRAQRRLEGAVILITPGPNLRSLTQIQQVSNVFRDAKQRVRTSKARA